MGLKKVRECYACLHGDHGLCRGAAGMILCKCQNKDCINRRKRDK